MLESDIWWSQINKKNGFRMYTRGLQSMAKKQLLKFSIDVSKNGNLLKNIWKKLSKDIIKAHMLKLKGLLMAIKLVAWGPKYLIREN